MIKLVIGFIGVGLMGYGMVKNIVEKGYLFVVMVYWNCVLVEDFLVCGVMEVGMFKEMVEKCDIIYLCVFGSLQVE